MIGKKLTTKELMIGDLVNWNGKCICRIEPKDIDLCDKAMIGWYYEPIPITDEILEKNGFAVDQYAIFHLNDTFGMIGIFYNEDFKKWDLDVSLDERNNKRVHIDIDSVHELQHALRLCRINKEIKL